MLWISLIIFEKHNHPSTWSLLSHLITWWPTWLINVCQEIHLIYSFLNSFDKKTTQFVPTSRFAKGSYICQSVKANTFISVTVMFFPPTSFETGKKNTVISWYVDAENHVIKKCCFLPVFMRVFLCDIYILWSIPFTACWLGKNPSEKYDLVTWDDEIPNIWGKFSKWQPNHQPDEGFPEGFLQEQIYTIPVDQNHFIRKRPFYDRWN